MLSLIKLKVSRKETYGSLDLGIIAPNSFILSFMLNLLRRSTAQSKTFIETKPCNDTVYKQYITRACVFWTHWYCDYLSFASPSWRLWHLCLKINSCYNYHTTNNWNKRNTEAGLSKSLPVNSLLILGRSAGQELLTVIVGVVMPGLL